MKKYVFSLFILFLIIISTGCYDESHITTVLSASEINATENGAFTSDGRFFTISSLPATNPMVYFSTSYLYEIVKKNDGTYDKKEIATGTINGSPCFFSGLTAKGTTLYAACTTYSFVPIPGLANPMVLPVNATLFRIRTHKAENDPARIQTSLLSGHNVILANGMAVDRNNNIYISNSYAPSAAMIGLNEAAIIKVTITDQEQFAIEETDWLPMAQGGFFPNGIQIKNNTMFYASANVLSKIKINRDGSAGEIKTVYTTSEQNLLDDLAILPGAVAVAEISTPLVAPTTEPVSKITIVSQNKENTILDEVFFDEGVLPSSVSLARKSCLFKKGSLIITDIFYGGLYEIGLY